MIPVLIPAYAPPISYMAWMMQQDRIYWVTDSHYKKQTYRNRAYIYGANGRLTLTIPIVHKRQQQHQKENQVQTDTHARWQQLHWKSLQAAYRSAPFFEFYEDALAPLYIDPAPSLFQFNRQFIDVILSLLEVSIPQEEQSLEMQNHQMQESLLDAKKPTQIFPTYTQVFENKYGFLSDLSSLDAIFHLGPEARSYILSCGKGLKPLLP